MESKEGSDAGPILLKKIDGIDFRFSGVEAMGTDAVT